MSKALTHSKSQDMLAILVVIKFPGNICDFL